MKLNIPAIALGLIIVLTIIILGKFVLDRHEKVVSDQEISKIRQAGAVQGVAPQIHRVNQGRPASQIGGKTLIMALMSFDKIPNAETWCDDMNLSPNNYVMNSKVAGKNPKGGVGGNCVVFFESDTVGRNQHGGKELLPTSDRRIAVVLGDGRALMMRVSEVRALSWEP